MLKYSLFSLVLASGWALAADQIPVQDPTPTNVAILVNRETLGTGVPGQQGLENNVFEYVDGTLHVPQYLPGNPTAATIWPRVVDVNCTKNVDGNVLTCEGYHWLPEMGRGEYLLLHPVVVEPPKPIIVEKTKVVTVIKEVPVKKKHE